MENKLDKKLHNFLKPLLLSLSLIISSTILGMYLSKSRQYSRNVTVRGLAERDVKANIGVWPICFRVAENELSLLYKKIEAQSKSIVDFLYNQGFKPEEITYGIPEIEDKDARFYGQDRKFRYVAQIVITVRSNNVETLEQSLQKCKELVEKGVVLENERWEYRPKYIFNNLNEIKPSMIQEATLEARKAAEQFAQDSGSKVGHIQQATQGNFSIEDTHIPTQKHVRVVTNIQYLLLDK